jgi:Ca-activated chloride channel family protein
VSFEWPIGLVALVLVPLAAAGYVALERRRGDAVARFSNPSLYPNLVRRRPGWRGHVPAGLLLAALTALLIGFARPQASVSAPLEKATIVLAIDVSRSMAATDVKPTRLGAAKAAANAFLDKVPEKYSVGLVAFESKATVASPATTDRSVTRQAIAALRPGEGTAIGDAIVRAIDVARAAGATGVPQSLGDAQVRAPSAILLLSDGAQTQGAVTPQAAAGRARQEHIPVYTVALGTDQGVVERTLQGGFTERIRVPPDPQTLRQIAGTTGAEFYTVADQQRLKQVYEDLGSRLARKKQQRELTVVLAGVGGLLAAAGALLSAFWFQRMPLR